MAPRIELTRSRQLPKGSGLGSLACRRLCLSDGSLAVPGEHGGGPMSWNDDQDALLQPAYLQLLSPEGVFQELKRLSGKVTSFSTPYKDIEPDLYARGEPLIDLALGAYSTNDEVYAALYQRSLEPPVDTIDAQRKHGLRVACLSNQVLVETRLLFHFPSEIIGEDEVYRILAVGTDEEMKALLGNPALDTKLIEDIFSLRGLIAELPDERKRTIVYRASKNTRIGVEKEYDDSPDMEHYGIQKAIFTLLEAAPANMAWQWVVDDVLNTVEPGHSYTPDRVDHVIQKWRALKFPKSRDDSTEQDGYFTNLSRGEELACFIAILFGKTYKDGKIGYIGSPSSSDMVMRCSYYANATMTEKEMKAAYKRDGNAYLYGACFNRSIKADRQLRKFFEEEQLTGDLRRVYEKYLRLLEKRRPYVKSLSSELFVAENTPTTTEEQLASMQKKVTATKTAVDGLQAKLQYATTIAFVVIVVVAISYWIKR